MSSKTQPTKRKSTNTAKLLYGETACSEILQENLAAAGAALEGCIIGKNGPKYECNACAYEP